MSSIDSALNSLSAVTVEDFVRPHLGDDPAPRQLLLVGRIGTVLWGLFAVGFAFQVEAVAPTVLEAVNKVGSMVNGPLLALIGSAILLRAVTQAAALTGFAAGLLSNALVALYLPEVSWLWWNVIGFAVAGLVTYIANRLLSTETTGTVSLQPSTISSVVTATRPPAGFIATLLAAFAVILSVCLVIQSW
jgi:SSS family solute:Na+ symporter